MGGNSSLPRKSTYWQLVPSEAGDWFTMLTEAETDRSWEYFQYVVGEQGGTNSMVLGQAAHRQRGASLCLQAWKRTKSKVPGMWCDGGRGQGLRQVMMVVYKIDTTVIQWCHCSSDQTSSIPHSFWGHQCIIVKSLQMSQLKEHKQVLEYTLDLIISFSFES